jgi:NitT/TauT family transport system substrate-binding protein
MRIRSKLTAVLVAALLGITGVAVSVSLLVPAGCKRQETTGANGETNKVRIGYIGITCEAPLFTAVEKGFFKEEGLEVEMVRCEWATYKDALALGRYDVTHHLVMYFLKPIEQGLDVKFTGGVHRGCLRVQAPTNGNIKSIADLRGKRIGVPGMGTPPFMFASRVLGANGVDPSTEVNWRVYPAAELGLALDRGLVDAIANSEPIGSLLIASGKVRNIADQAMDAPYKDEYCCAVLVNGKFLEKNPKASAAATRAILKAAKWVDANPLAAARLSVERRYIASSVPLNAVALSRLTYVPSVQGGHDAILSAGEEMKKAGMLSGRTDVAELTRKAFVRLDGVTDDWLKSVYVEKVAGGQIPSGVDLDRYATAGMDFEKFIVEVLGPTYKGCCSAKQRTD